MNETTLTRNTLAFIALANEYCQEMENVLDKDKTDFITLMLRQLPRLYIAVSDVVEQEREEDTEQYVVVSYLTEDEYNSVRNNVYHILGEDDVEDGFSP